MKLKNNIGWYGTFNEAIIAALAIGWLSGVITVVLIIKAAS